MPFIMRRTFGRRFLMVINVCGLLFMAAQVSAQAQKTSRPREVKATPAGEVEVVLNEQFLNSVLDAMFMLPRAPAFPLSIARAHDSDGGSTETNRREASNANGCVSEVTLAREINGTHTAVRFQEGRILVPVAFKGSYSNVLVGCLKYQGWAETNIDLAFDQERQLLTAHINVRELHLEGIPSLLNNPITGLVQNAIDARVNPVGVLRAEQLAARIPIAAAGGALLLRAKEVRHEVVGDKLRLRIFYEIIRAE